MPQTVWMIGNWEIADYSCWLLFIFLLATSTIILHNVRTCSSALGDLFKAQLTSNKTYDDAMTAALCWYELQSSTAILFLSS